MAKPTKPISSPAEAQFVDTVGDGVEMFDVGVLDVETSAIVMRDNVVINSDGNKVRMPDIGKVPAMVALADVQALIGALVQRCSNGTAAGHGDLVKLKCDVAALAD